MIRAATSNTEIVNLVVEGRLQEFREASPKIHALNRREASWPLALLCDFCYSGRRNGSRSASLCDLGNVSIVQASSPIQVAGGGAG